MRQRDIYLEFQYFNSNFRTSFQKFGPLFQNFVSKLHLFETDISVHGGSNPWEKPQREYP